MQIGLHINSIGEIHRHGEYLRDVSTCHLPDLAKAANLTWPPEQPAGLDSPAWREAIRLHYQTEEFLHLSDGERAFLARVRPLQDVVARRSRWRVYGLWTEKKEMIDLSTEFIAFDAEAETWKQIRELAASEGCRLTNMDERPHLDRSSTHRGPGPIPEESWVNGPRHGEMETQVSLNWNVRELSATALARLVDVLDITTQPLWELCGVSVL